MDLFELCDDLEMNITAKRHYKRDGVVRDGAGCWDMRITHSFFNGPILTSCSKSSLEECVSDLTSRMDAIEKARVGIERKNKLRADQFAKDPKYDDTDDWVERIY